MNYSYCGQTCVFKWYSLAEKMHFVWWSMLKQTQTRPCSVRLWDGLCPPSSCKCKWVQTKNHYHTVRQLTKACCIVFGRS